MLTRQYPLTVNFRMFHNRRCRAMLLAAWELFLLQQKAVRLISSHGYIDHCWPIFIELGVLSLYSKFILSSLKRIGLPLSISFQPGTTITSIAPRETDAWVFLTVDWVRRRTAFPMLLSEWATICRKIWRAKPTESLRAASRPGCWLGLFTH